MIEHFTRRGLRAVRPARSPRYTSAHQSRLGPHRDTVREFARVNPFRFYWVVATRARVVVCLRGIDAVSRCRCGSAPRTTVVALCPIDGERVCEARTTVWSVCTPRQSWLPCA